MGNCAMSWGTFYFRHHIAGECLLVMNQMASLDGKAWSMNSELIESASAIVN
jgi:hypothetical protein